VVIVAILVVAGLAAAVFYLFRSTDEGPSTAAPGGTGTASSPSAQACPAGLDPVTVSVAPAMEGVVSAAAGRVTDADPCDTFSVTAADSSTVAKNLASGNGTTPAAWVPDSSVFIDSVRAAKPDVLAGDMEEFATSPLVFAVPTPIAAKAGAALASPSWSAFVSGDQTLPVRLPDPESTTSGRLLLLNAPTALGNSPAVRIALGRVLLAWTHSPMPKEQDLFAAATTEQAGIFPTSEQAVASNLKVHPGTLAAVVPSEGTGRYTYSLVLASGIPDHATDALTALRTQLTNEAGKTDVKSAGFRVRDGGEQSGPGVPGIPSQVKYLPDPSVEQQAALVKTWTGMKADARMLALIDTSGSMREQEGDKTRMELAGEAAQTAVSIFPNSSQLGLWTFGLNKGGPGQDWRELVPIRQLDESVDGKPQRQVLTETLPGLLSSAGGGTGLYDTLLAAYQQMVSTYAPGRVNSVILLTDGRNEDPSGLTLEQLLAKISQTKDPNKPVVIITVGMGQKVDTAALTAVSALTGGKSYIALDPNDIKQVFIDALLSRDCTGSTCTSR
jgi:hypothetical protein